MRSAPRGEVAKTIRWWAARRKLSDAARGAIDTTCGNLADRTRTRLLGHQEALRDGLPTATGVIEGACRHVVKDRTDRTDARWSLTGAKAVLRLHAIRASRDFDAYWAFHLGQERTRNHASRGRPDPRRNARTQAAAQAGQVIHFVEMQSRRGGAAPKLIAASIGAGVQAPAAGKLDTSNAALVHRPDPRALLCDAGGRSFSVLVRRCPTSVAL